MQRLSHALRSSGEAFRRDRRGNVAVMFALALLPVIGLVGAAIDYGRANTLRTEMQAALDSTALMLSKEAATDNKKQLQANAAKYFNAMFTGKTVNNLDLKASYTQKGGSAVTVSGSADMPTSFMGVVGYNTIAIGGSSTAKWGSTRLRVALVLDNTGSMASAGKMSALKTATTSLLSQLQSAASVDGDVYVSIVPFVKDVNVGASNYKADWVYWGNSSQDPDQTDDSSWEAKFGSCSKNSFPLLYPSPRAACLAFNKNAVWTPASHDTWNGCVMDRGYPKSPSNLSGNSGPDTTNNYDTNVASVDSKKPASMYAAEQYGQCPEAAVMGLSYDWSTMTTLVSNMSPNGNTNQAIGLQLGWLSLVGGGPFAAPKMDPDYKYSQIIILLTDGLNTEDRWYSNQNSIDMREQITCNNIKNTEITLYTIQVNTDGEPTSTLLQNCASSPDKFFLLTSASQIVSTFQAIGTNLTQLRIAK
jgi:Flp pilus assembly protein TadG